MANGTPGGGPTVVTNATNAPAGVPDVQSAAQMSIQANAVGQAGGYVSNGQHLPSVPEEQDAFTGGQPLTTQTGTADTNVTKTAGGV